MKKKKTDLQSDFQLKAVQILILLQIYISTSSVTSDGPTLFADCFTKRKTSYFVCLFFFVILKYHITCLILVLCQSLNLWLVGSPAKR